MENRTVFDTEEFFFLILFSHSFFNILINENKKRDCTLRRRRLMWITPCKRSAARGRTTGRITPVPLELRSSTHYGVEVRGFLLPRIPLSLHTGLSTFASSEDLQQRTYHNLFFHSAARIFLNHYLRN